MGPDIFGEVFLAVYASLSVIGSNTTVLPPQEALISGIFMLGGLRLKAHFERENGTSRMETVLTEDEREFADMLYDTTERIINNTDSKRLEMIKDIRSFINSSIDNIDTITEIRSALLPLFTSHSLHHFKEPVWSAPSLLTVDKKGYLESLNSRNIMNITLNSNSSLEKLLELEHIFHSDAPMYTTTVFLELILNTSTTSIIDALEKDVFQSRHLMDSFKKFICHNVLNMLISEGFSLGITGQVSVTNFRNIASEVESAITSLREFVLSIKLSKEAYWTSAIFDEYYKNIAQISMGNSKHYCIGDEPDNCTLTYESQNQIAEEIKDRLEGIYTTDVFGIYVLDHRSSRAPFFWPNLIHDGRQLFSEVPSDDWKYQDFPPRIVILRSAKFHEFTEEAYLLVRDNIQAFVCANKMFERTHFWLVMERYMSNNVLLWNQATPKMREYLGGPENERVYETESHNAVVDEFISMMSEIAPQAHGFNTMIDKILPAIRYVNGSPFLPYLNIQSSKEFFFFLWK